MFTRKERISTKVFQEVIQHNKTLYGSCVYIRYKENNLPYQRFAVVVPKSVEKRAVHRNILKRRVREYIKKYTEKLPLGYDFIFFVKSKDRSCIEKTLSFLFAQSQKELKNRENKVE